MVITTCQRAMKLFPPTWQHHHLMIASTTVPIIQWQLIFFLGVDQYTKANLRLDASLPPCTLRSHHILFWRGGEMRAFNVRFALKAKPKMDAP